MVAFRCPSLHRLYGCAPFFATCGILISAMAVLSALRRFARLGFWVGLGAGAMLVDACDNVQWRGGQDSAPDAPSSDVPSSKPDALATPDAGVDARAVDTQSADADQAEPADGGKTDLWDTICE
jgi:hypothetical protein